MARPDRRARRNRAEAQVGDITRGNDVGTIAEQVLAEAPPRFALAGFSLGG
ncbi:hypothetical protein [Methylobacterium nigriterrae]|uniref:hypothetical protein n=1 Tax=Methylobacterium nigriterrae TaxID=3127512 RepID=UPI0030137BFA